MKMNIGMKTQVSLEEEKSEKPKKERSQKNLKNNKKKVCLSKKCIKNIRITQKENENIDDK